jgi:hypothetical protein
MNSFGNLPRGLDLRRGLGVALQCITPRLLGKGEILDEIRRCAAQDGGIPLVVRRCCQIPWMVARATPPHGGQGLLRLAPGRPCLIGDIHSCPLGGFDIRERLQTACPLNLPSGFELGFLALEIPWQHADRRCPAAQSGTPPAAHGTLVGSVRKIPRCRTPSDRRVRGLLR